MRSRPNGRSEPAPEWARRMEAAVDRMATAIEADRRLAAEDRKQAAEDRRHAAEDRALMRGSLEQLAEILRSLFARQEKLIEVNQLIVAQMARHGELLADMAGSLRRIEHRFGSGKAPDNGGDGRG